MSKKRFRDLEYSIGHFRIGRNNAITDVPGVLVGQVTLNYDQPRVAKTGVTVILPRGKHIWDDYAFAGFYSLNGNGEMTGLQYISETGLLTTPIALTNTYQVGTVRDAVVEYARSHGYSDSLDSPVVAETDDSLLNDIDARHINLEHVFTAIETAKNGFVEEGNVGAGTGLVSFDFKAGIGTSSRIININGQEFTLGVLVQANVGDRKQLRINGISVGSKIGYDLIPNPWRSYHHSGSIIVVIATDAPLLSIQCSRLARRSALGLGRVGCMGHDYSGDMLLAFSTGNHYPESSNSILRVAMVPHENMDVLFEAVVEATEEAIVNSIVAAETMVGYNNRKANAIPIELLQRILDTYEPSI